MYMKCYGSGGGASFNNSLGHIRSVRVYDICPPPINFVHHIFFQKISHVQNCYEGGAGGGGGQKSFSRKLPTDPKGIQITVK